MTAVLSIITLYEVHCFNKSFNNCDFTIIQRYFRSSSIYDLSCFIIGSVFVFVQCVQYLYMLHDIAVKQ